MYPDVCAGLAGLAEPRARRTRGHPLGRDAVEPVWLRQLCVISAASCETTSSSCSSSFSPRRPLVVVLLLGEEGCCNPFGRGRTSPPYGRRCRGIAALRDDDKEAVCNPASDCWNPWADVGTGQPSSAAAAGSPGLVMPRANPDHAGRARMLKSTCVLGDVAHA